MIRHQYKIQKNIITNHKIRKNRIIRKTQLPSTINNASASFCILSKIVESDSATVDFLFIYFFWKKNGEFFKYSNIEKYDYYFLPMLNTNITWIGQLEYFEQRHFENLFAIGVDQWQIGNCLSCSANSNRWLRSQNWQDNIKNVGSHQFVLKLCQINSFFFWN